MHKNQRTSGLAATKHRPVCQIAGNDSLEDQRLQNHKMEAIGRLAGGIAHDFNNLLVPIIGYIELAMMHTLPDTKLHGELSQVRKAAERATDLTRQILAFSRQQVLEMRVLDLNEVIGNFRKVSGHVMAKDIEMVTSLVPSLYPVKADRRQIEQVLLNLVINARDAMPHGGRITIETDNIYLDELHAEALLGTSAEGLYAMIAVSDTGLGMDDETLKYIFEPFFTTKEKGKGTGLGLATVFGIIKQHQGTIRVFSEPGAGSTFRIYLPKTEDTRDTATAPAAEPASIFGTETVLVVEDDEMVRSLVCETLAAHGYHVLKASGPSEGIHIASNHKGRIHLVLTDVIMPEMNGRKLIRKISAIRPGIKVLYMSGYTNNLIHRGGRMEEGVTLLQKPFTANTLTREVRKILN